MPAQQIGLTMGVAWLVMTLATSLSAQQLPAAGRPGQGPGQGPEQVRPARTARRISPRAVGSTARSAAVPRAERRSDLGHRPAARPVPARSRDEDLARVITSGTPGGMPPFTLQPAELAGIVAFIRAGFDATASVKVGDAERGDARLRGQGQRAARATGSNGRGPRVAPDLSDIGLARTPAALQRSLLDPSSAMLPINRPVRIVTTGRRDDPRPPAERGHLHRADHRRARSGCGRSTKADMRTLRGRHAVADAVVCRPADRRRDRRPRRLPADAEGTIAMSTTPRRRRPEPAGAAAPAGALAHRRRAGHLRPAAARRPTSRRTG